MSERAMLMQLVEAAEGIEPNWEDALHRAGYRGRYFPQSYVRLGPRRVLVLVAAALAVFYAMAALAAQNPRVGPAYWLFDRSGKTYPVNQEPTLGGWAMRKRGTLGAVQTKEGSVSEVKAVPVLQGSVAGHRFEMSVLIDENGRTVGPMAVRGRGGAALSFGFSGGGPAEPSYGTNVPSVGSGSLAAPVHGLPLPPRAEEPEVSHWVSLTLSIPEGIEATGGGTGPKWLFGVANPRVTRVELENENDGTVVSVPTFAGPDESPVRVRFWVAVLRLDELVHNVVPRDKDGEALEHWELTMAL